MDYVHLTVRGYAYNDVSWAIQAPALVPRNAGGGYSVQGQFWAGGIIEATVPAAGHVTDDFTYQIKLAEKGSSIARFRRFRGDAVDPEPGEHRVALLEMDAGLQVLDRLTGAVLSWHADLLGDGPAAKRRRRAA